MSPSVITNFQIREALLEERRTWRVYAAAYEVQEPLGTLLDERKCLVGPARAASDLHQEAAHHLDALGDALLKEAEQLTTTLATHQDRPIVVEGAAS